MNAKAFLFIALVSIVPAGCDRGGPQPENAVPPTEETAAIVEAPKLPANEFTGPRAPANTIQVEAPVADGAATPLRMNGGETIATAFAPDRSGTLLALGVRIGNSRGTSDGSLSLNFCEAAVCQDVAVPLAGTRDNGYLIFNLTTPVQVVAGKTYDFKLSRSADATKSVAIWTHPAPPGSPTVIGADSADTDRVAKLVFYFKK